jgi:hypothetical protein
MRVNGELLIKSIMAPLGIIVARRMRAIAMAG